MVGYDSQIDRRRFQLVSHRLARSLVIVFVLRLHFFFNWVFCFFIDFVLFFDFSNHEKLPLLPRIGLRYCSHTMRSRGGAWGAYWANSSSISWSACDQGYVLCSFLHLVYASWNARIGFRHWSEVTEHESVILFLLEFSPWRCLSRQRVLTGGRLNYGGPSKSRALWNSWRVPIPTLVLGYSQFPASTSCKQPPTYSYRDRRDPRLRCQHHISVENELSGWKSEFDSRVRHHVADRRGGRRDIAIA